MSRVSAGQPHKVTSAKAALVAGTTTTYTTTVAFDHAIRAADAALIASGKVGRLVGLPFLHPSCVPLDEVVFDPADERRVNRLGLREECRGVCGV